MNEWYAKDMSRKMRSTLKIKNSQGYAIGRPPLGYVYDEMDKNPWFVDEKGAQIVRYIFELRKQGESMNKIAKVLKKKKVYIPSVYAAKKGVSKPIAKPPLNEHLWNHGMIQRILTNQSYVGDVVNVKIYSSREPRHAIRERIIELFSTFIARLFLIPVGKLANTSRTIHNKRWLNLLIVCRSIKKTWVAVQTWTINLFIITRTITTFRAVINVLKTVCARKLTTLELMF